MSILLETKNLELAYGAFHAVNGVNLKVEAGTSTPSSAQRFTRILDHQLRQR